MDYNMEDLILLVSELAQKYAGYESTSVSYEKAQQLMGAVLYCLEECRHSADMVPFNQAWSVKDQYRAGLELLTKKVIKIKELFHALSTQFEDFGVHCLYDTVQKGIPEFLKWYDIKFCPQDTILTLDYPVLSDYGSFTGADAVYCYLYAIKIEQQFLKAFDKSYVTAVLKRYDLAYRDMVENVCRILLTDTIGHVALQKPFGDMGFQDEDILRLAELFGYQSVSNLADLVRRLIGVTVARVYENDKEMTEYLCCDADNMAMRIHSAVQYGQLDKIFI